MGLKSVLVGMVACALLITYPARAAGPLTVPPPDRSLVPLGHPRITYHADTAFTDYERLLLAQAQSNVAVQTSGAVAFELVYDFDVALLPIRPGGRAWLLLRAQGNGVPWVEWFDGVIGGTLLGLTKRADHEVFIFVDRLDLGDRFVHVAMHEALHAAGVEHTEGGAIMGSMMPRGAAATCMNALDALAVCNAMGCDPRGLAFCLPDDRCGPTAKTIFLGFDQRSGRKF